MIYIETGSTDVNFNLALEYYIASQKQFEDTVFLIWHTTPTLVVGKYQNTLEEINREYAEKHNITVVRRMSGGGTMFIDLGGWQFTFIDRDEDGSIHFQEYTRPIVDALRALDIPADFNGRNDLLIEGKKISGNAQYKVCGRTVHHGTLMFDVDVEQMVASTTVDDYKIVSKGIKSVRSRVTNIAEHLKAPMDGEAFKNHIVSYIMRDGDNRYALTEEDIAAVNRIAAEKFASWEARYGMNPKYSLTKQGRFAGGRITFSMDVRKGVIEAVSVSGDFFAGEKADGLAAALVGCRCEKEAVKTLLDEQGFDGAVYGITTEDIAQTIAG